MNGDDFQKGTVRVDMAGTVMTLIMTHEWKDDEWKEVDYGEQVITYNFSFSSVGGRNSFTLSNGLIDGEAPTQDKGENAPLFEGTWTKQ